MTEIAQAIAETVKLDQPLPEVLPPSYNMEKKFHMDEAPLIQGAVKVFEEANSRWAEELVEDKTIDLPNSGNSIRQRFLQFYASRGHEVLPSASLVPDDPTVLLTIAGMLQFKPIFLGQVFPFCSMLSLVICIGIHIVGTIMNLLHIPLTELQDVLVICYLMSFDH